MIPVSTEYVQNIYANVREFKSRVRIEMSKHDSDFTGAMTYDYKDIVPEEGAKIESSAYRAMSTTTPMSHWNEFETAMALTKDYYDEISYMDGIYSVMFANKDFFPNEMMNLLFAFDIVDIFTEKFGPNIWWDAVELYKKVDKVKQMINKIKFTWIGQMQFPEADKRYYIGPWNNVSGTFYDYGFIGGDHEIEVLELCELNFEAEERSFVYSFNDCIDTFGRMYFRLQSPKNTTTEQVIVRTEYVKMDFELKNIKIFEDPEIISINAIEEISVLSESLPANEAQITLSNESGELDFMSLDNMFSIIATMPKVWADLGLVLPGGMIEWVPIGTWFLTEWKNDNTSKVVSLTAQDWFSILGEKPYMPRPEITNLKTLAYDVLAAGGIPSDKFYVDTNLGDYTIRPLTEITDCRTVLQHIGIVGRAAVRQDRYGTVRIERFFSLGEESNYLNYPTYQNSIFGYPGSGNHLLNNTVSGMKRIDQDYMYQPAAVSLERSIYQLVIKVYDSAEPTEYIYENPSIVGTNGQSFTIDNPLINTKDLADSIAEWYMKELNYNAVYNVNWRQNPALEATDLILVEDPFGNEKQSRIVQQEFNYIGALDGNTSTRGGV